MNRPRILLADDHLVVLQQVTKLLQSVLDVWGRAHRSGNGLGGSPKPYRDSRERWSVHQGFSPVVR